MSRFEGKTEQPTPKRRRKARREGQIARSHEVAVAAGLGVTLIWARVLFPKAARDIADGTRELFSRAGQLPPGASVRSLALSMLVAALGPLLALAFFSAIAAGAAQGGVVLASAAAKPKMSRLSPKQALERFRPSALAWELARTVAKLGLVALIVAGPIREAMRAAQKGRSFDGWVSLAAASIWSILLRVTIAFVVLAAIDYLVSRRRILRQQRMTKQEVREEHKESEGDPLVKGARRRRHMELSRNRMIRDVAAADVVILNPTRLAVALSYRDGDRAPKVVAKGSGLLAKRIRAEASRNGVLIRQDKPLCRAIYRRCKVGQEIPAALYEAVAVLLAAAYRRRRAGAA